MEQLNIKNLLETAKDVGSFVLTRLMGGAWAETAETVIQPASITYFSTGAQNEKSANTAA